MFFKRLAERFIYSTFQNYYASGFFESLYIVNELIWSTVLWLEFLQIFYYYCFFVWASKYMLNNNKYDIITNINRFLLEMLLIFETMKLNVVHLYTILYMHFCMIKLTKYLKNIIML